MLFVLLGTGVVVLIGNYMNFFPGGTSNWRLIYGLGLVTGGFLVATQWH